MAKYKDFNLLFEAHPVTGDILMVEDEEAVTASIRNLIFMSHYEKPFHPEIGCAIKNLLFEFMSPITALHIKNLILNTINNFEPRAKIYKMEVTPVYAEYGYDVQIWFYVLDRSDIVTITLPLRRLR